MWNRKVFLCLCLITLGVFCIVLLQITPPKAPELIPNVTRYRLSRVCASDAMLLVISAPQNTHRRQMIRETWGLPQLTEHLGLSVAFGVGAGEGTEQSPLDWEAETYGDVFQVPLKDSYFALSQKILKILEMAKEACPATPFIIKVDDDMFVNVFSLKQLLQSILDEDVQHKLWCLVWKGMPVIRLTDSKWSVTREQYNDTTYPIYCSGSAYLIQKRALDLILSTYAVHRDAGETPFPVEDVYITGILAQEAGITHEQLGPRYAFESTNDEDIASGKTVFAHLGPKAPQMTSHLWNVVTRTHQKELTRLKETGML